MTDLFKDIRFKYYECAQKNAGICLLWANDVRQCSIAEIVHLSCPCPCRFNILQFLDACYKIDYFQIIFDTFLLV